jgi:hypothetical protein
MAYVLDAVGEGRAGAPLCLVQQAKQRARLQQGAAGLAGSRNLKSAGNSLRNNQAVVFKERIVLADVQKGLS